MTRVEVLRAGYASLGLAFVALAGTYVLGSLVLVALGLGLIAGMLLAFCDDDRPKWSGLALIAFFVLALVAFLASTPMTINRGERYFVNPAPPDLAGDILYWMGLLAPLVLVAAAVGAAWERERAPRVLLVSAAGGFILAALLGVFLVPSGSDTQAAAVAARAQADLLSALFAVSAVAGAAGALWAASRPDSL